MVSKWINSNQLESKSYTCGYCNNFISSEKGYYGHDVPQTQFSEPENYVYIYICHVCDNPTYFNLIDEQFPSPAYGYKVEHVDSKEVLALYNEARNCFKVNAYTAAVLCCRKLLMNIAVAQGASLKLNFYDYVKFLADNGFVPPDAKEVLDFIREKGNEATHEIKMVNKYDAVQLINFLGIIMKIIFEFPGSLKKEKKLKEDLPF